MFEAGGAPAAIQKIHEQLCPGCRIILVGMPVGSVPIDIVSLAAKEASIETVFATLMFTREPWLSWHPKKSI